MDRNIELAFKLNEKDESEALASVGRDGIIDFFRYVREILFFDFYARGEKETRLPYLVGEAKKCFIAFAKEEGCAPCLFDSFFDGLPEVKRLLVSDADAIFQGDPACASPAEAILTYPGFLAISAYRVAHLLRKLGLRFVSRVLSEYAHSRTGIDINPGAEIGERFFIDHGTGIVIGETTVIGKNVKIYQGVTLGALSLREGRKLAGHKRHPTVEDNVTIYSGASIFGGDTVIGEGSTVSSNAYIVSSIPPHSIAVVKPFDLEIRAKAPK